MQNYGDLDTSPRTLLEPGPSTVHPRVLRAMAHPLVGHLDPEFVALMNEVQDMLRYVYQTENTLTVPISGTGSAAMEASLCNFVEPGDSVLIGVYGYFYSLCWKDVFDGSLTSAAEFEKEEEIKADGVRCILKKHTTDI